MRLTAPSAIARVVLGARFASLVPRSVIKEITNALGEAPKRAPNAYALFSSDSYAAIAASQQQPGGGPVPLTTIAPMVAAKWRQAPEEVKNEYRARAKELVRTRGEAEAAFEARCTERERAVLDLVEYNRLYSKGKINRRDIPQEILQLAKDLPCAPFSTPKGLFTSDRARGNPEALKIVPTLHAQWDALPQSEREEYVRRVNNDIRTFKENLGKFLKAA